MKRQLKFVWKYHSASTQDTVFFLFLGVLIDLSCANGAVFNYLLVLEYDLLLVDGLSVFSFLLTKLSLDCLLSLRLKLLINFLI